MTDKRHRSGTHGENAAPCEAAYPADGALAYHPPAPVTGGSPDARAVGNDHSLRHPRMEKLQVDETNAEVDQQCRPVSPPEIYNNTPVSRTSVTNHVQPDMDNNGSAAAKPSSRPRSPASIRRGSNDTANKKKDEHGICRIHRFWLYETARRFYVVGGNVTERRFRLLKIDRSADNVDLSIAEDDIVYTKQDMNQLLDTLDDGNKASGGMKLKYSFWGLLGFVRFTGAYYMLLITKKSPVAVIGGHYIYQIDGTELISLTASSHRSKVDKDPEEARFIGILNNLDLTRWFYFSYSYDVTHTLQRNLLRKRHDLQRDKAESPSTDINSMFVWNHHFLKPVSAVLKTAYDWCLPIVHGFVDQASILFPAAATSRG